MSKKKKILIFIALVFLTILMLSPKKEAEIIPRESKIPADAIKMTPKSDLYPPILHSNEYKKPVPLDAVNTAGGEDSPFIPSDRNEFYFFFTPDVKIPVEKQVSDGVTGIYISEIENSAFKKATKVILQKSGKLALDGCEFVKGNDMIFCSAREGFTGIHWFSASWDSKKQKWCKWKKIDFPESYKVGELHVHGDDTYYHSDKNGGKGKNDIWVMKRKADGTWGKPENIGIINTTESEFMPFLTADGNELWFNREYRGTPAIMRSKKISGKWQKPEMIISQFAGEPTLDSKGNIYFVHHYYKNSKMIEADIYVAYRK